MGVFLKLLLKFIACGFANVFLELSSKLKNLFGHCTGDKRYKDKFQNIIRKTRFLDWFKPVKMNSKRIYLR